MMETFGNDDNFWNCDSLRIKIPVKIPVKIQLAKASKQFD